MYFRHVEDVVPTAYISPNPLHRYTYKTSSNFEKDDIASCSACGVWPIYLHM